MANFAQDRRRKK